MVILVVPFTIDTAGICSLLDLCWVIDQDVHRVRARVEIIRLPSRLPVTMILPPLLRPQTHIFHTLLHIHFDFALKVDYNPSMLQFNMILQ